MTLSELKTLTPIDESAMSNLHQEKVEALESAIENEYNCDKDMAEKIVNWLINNADEPDAEEFLRDYYIENGELKSQNDDAANWLSNHVPSIFRQEMKGL